MLDADTKAPAPTGSDMRALPHVLTQERIVSAGQSLRPTEEELQSSWNAAQLFDMDDPPNPMASLLCKMDDRTVLCRFASVNSKGDVTVLLPPRRLFAYSASGSVGLEKDTEEGFVVPAAELGEKLRVLPGRVPDLRWTAIAEPARFHGHAVKIGNTRSRHIVYNTVKPITKDFKYVSFSSALPMEYERIRSNLRVKLSELYVDPSRLASRGSREEWEQECAYQKSLVPLSIAGVVANGTIDQRARTTLLVESTRDVRGDALLSRFATNKDVSGHFRIPLDTDTSEDRVPKLQQITWQQLYNMSRHLDPTSGIRSPYVWLSSPLHDETNLRVAIRCSKDDSSVEILVNQTVLNGLLHQKTSPIHPWPTYTDTSLEWVRLTNEQVKEFKVSIAIDQQCDHPVAPSWILGTHLSGSASRLTDQLLQSLPLYPDASGVIADYLAPLARRLQFEQGEPVHDAGLPFGHPVIYHDQGSSEDFDFYPALYLGTRMVNGEPRVSALIHRRPPNTDLPRSSGDEWTLRNDMPSAKFRWLAIRHLNDDRALLLSTITSRNIGDAVIVLTDGPSPVFRTAKVVQLNVGYGAIVLEYEDGTRAATGIGISRVWLDPRQALGERRLYEASASMQSDGKHDSQPLPTDSQAFASPALTSSSALRSTTLSSTTNSGTTQSASLHISSSSPSSTTAPLSTRTHLPRQLDDKSRMAPLHSSQDIPPTLALRSAETSPPSREGTSRR